MKSFFFMKFQFMWNDITDIVLSNAFIFAYWLLSYTFFLNVRCKILIGNNSNHIIVIKYIHLWTLRTYLFTEKGNLTVMRASSKVVCVQSIIINVFITGDAGEDACTGLYSHVVKYWQNIMFHPLKSLFCKLSWYSNHWY